MLKHRGGERRRSELLGTRVLLTPTGPEVPKPLQLEGWGSTDRGKKIKWCFSPSRHQLLRFQAQLICGSVNLMCNNTKIIDDSHSWIDDVCAEGRRRDAAARNIRFKVNHLEWIRLIISTNSNTKADRSKPDLMFSLVSMARARRLVVWIFKTLEMWPSPPWGHRSIIKPASATVKRSGSEWTCHHLISRMKT